MRRLALAVAALSTLACSGLLSQSDVLEAYELARVEATTEPGPAGSDWTADAAVGLSHELVGAMVQQALTDLRPAPWTTGTPIGDLKVTPSLVVQSVTSRPGACPGCLDLVVAATGDAHWELAGVSGSTDYAAGATARVQLSTQVDGTSRVLMADVTRLQNVSFTAGVAKGIDLGPALEAWLAQAVDDALEATPLATVDTAELPLREIRPEVDAAGVRLAILTAAPHGGLLASMPVPAPGEWAASVSTDTLVSFAAQAGFDKSTGDQTVEVTSLSVTDDRFNLGLRIWSTAFPAWWHDYAVTGDIELTGGKLTLAPRNAEPGDASPGAGVVDSLAALAGTPIVNMITDALATTVPVPAAQAGGMTWNIARVEGLAGIVALHGTVTGGPAVAPGRPGRGGKAKSGGPVPPDPARPGRAGGRGKADSTRRPR
jgi:hypothetical protein